MTRMSPQDDPQDDTHARKMTRMSRITLRRKALALLY
jgi:hypothetical protein